MITPTTETGKPAAATARSMVGETSLAFPTTPINETSSSARLVNAAVRDGGVACSSSVTTVPSTETGRK